MCLECRRFNLLLVLLVLLVLPPGQPRQVLRSLHLGLLHRPHFLLMVEPSACRRWCGWVSSHA